LFIILGLVGRAPVVSVMSSDHVTETPANATTVGGYFVDLLNGTMTAPTEDAASSGNPYTVSDIVTARCTSA